MKIEEKKFQKMLVILSAASGGKTAKASSVFNDWLKHRNLPKTVRGFFERNAPVQMIWAGSGYLFDITEIMRVNDKFPDTVSDELLFIGSSPNGDFIALDYGCGNGRVGYVSHDMMYLDTSLRRFFIPVAGSIGDFIFKANNKEDFPSDYFDVAKYDTDTACWLPYNETTGEFGCLRKKDEYEQVKGGLQ